MSSAGDTNDVIDLSQSQSDKEHDPQPETPSGSKSPQNKENKKQKTLAFQSVTEGEKTLGVWKFDQQACRDSLVKMVITDE
ncbi:unnamed protein product [Camellia sinensis]